MNTAKIIKLYPSNDSQYKPSLLDNKQRYEVVISLFNECNMACTFCADRLRNTEKLSKHAVDLRIKHFNTLCDSGIFTQPHVDIKLFGGELFQDKYSDNQFGLCQYFVDTIKDKLESMQRTFQLFVSSNMIFKNQKRVFEWLKANKVIIRCSFDFNGRFTKRYQLQQFVKNVYACKDAGLDPHLAVIITNDCIDTIVNQQSCELLDVFNQFYSDGILAQFDYYDGSDTIMNSTSSIVDPSQPSEERLVDFMIYLDQHYADVDFIQEMYKASHQNRHCCHGATITDKLYYECCNLHDVTLSILDKKSCYTCPFFNICPGMCNRVFHNSGSFCHLKAFFEYLQAKQQ